MMLIPLIAVALQLTPQQEVAQKASEDQLKQWVKDHGSEIKQQVDRINRIKALTYDQALIVYDQCLAKAAASQDSVPPDDVFNRAHAMCLSLRAELLESV